MAEFDNLFIYLIIALFMVNIGLTAVEQAGFNLFGESPIGEDVSAESIYDSFIGLKPHTEQEKSCEGLDFLCFAGSGISFLGDILQYPIFFISELISLMLFIWGQFSTIFVGWAKVLMLIADTLESDAACQGMFPSGNCPIHTFMGGISAMIVIIIIFGFLALIRKARG